jgi:predicted amidophosphoribosyltransferase
MNNSREMLGRQDGMDSDPAPSKLDHQRLEFQPLRSVCATLRLRSMDGDWEMFCPKCGETLEQIDGAWTCRRGGMPLSPRLSAGFTDVYVLKTSTAQPGRATFLWAGTWYCPGCGIQTEEQAGTVVCPRCRQSLNEFLYDLIELHPHKDVNEHG